MPMNMPKVLDCNMIDCSYNKNKACHALAITVGDTSCPMCDTYAKIAKKGGAADMTGSVGACKVENCKFNQSLECTASNGIHVGPHSGHPDCNTFAPR